MKKFVAAAIVLALFAGFAVTAFAEDTAEAPKVTVGGHIKLTVYDRVNAISVTGTARNEINQSYGVTFKEIDLFVNAKINDWLSFEADPKFSLSTGATPKLGSKSPGASKDFSFSSMSHGRAVMMLELPWDVHMEIGLLHPVFTAEYGRFLFWEDEFNGGPWIVSHGPASASFHDSGIEMVKTFNFTDEISMPVYLYYLNGGGNIADNNNQPGVMLHIEPSYGPLTLLASAYAYKYDAAERLAQFAWALGMHFKWEGLEIRAEGAIGKEEETDPDDLVYEEGYMIKGLYKVLPWLKVFAMHESDFERNADAWGDIRKIKNAVGAVVFLSDATMIQAEVDIQEHLGTDPAYPRSIVWTRPSISVRSTF